jgi:hypothetical protein
MSTAPSTNARLAGGGGAAEIGVVCAYAVTAIKQQKTHAAAVGILTIMAVLGPGKGCQVTV